MKIIEKYNDNFTIGKISEIFNISSSTVYGYLLKNNIRIRTKSETLKGKNIGKHHTDIARKNISEGHKGQKAWNKNIPCSLEQKVQISKTLKSKSKITAEFEKEICKLYEDGLTIIEISNELNISSATTYSYLLKNNIRIRTKSELYIGSGNPSWNGGVSFEPYCPKFNENVREEVRNKYNRCCIICGKNEKENIVRKSGKFTKLHVHHIDYNKLQGCEGHVWKLAPLCNSCHGKTNHNKKLWETKISEMIFIFDEVENLTRMFKNIIEISRFI
jgi:DNA-binding CsgD family transcriptional regulator